MNSSFWQEFYFLLQFPGMQQVSDLFERGGPVLVLIAIAALLMLSLIIERFIYLGLFSKNEHSAFAKQWHQRSQHENWCAYRIRESLLAKYRQRVFASHHLIKLFLVLCPLLGLLGTVTGMISVFEVMAYPDSDYGTSNSVRSMAAGISKATIPTLAGIFVAITGLLLLAQLDRMAEKKQHLLTIELGLK